MDYSNIPNVQNKLKTLQGDPVGAVIVRIVLGVIFLLIAMVLFYGVFSSVKEKELGHAAIKLIIGIVLGFSAYAMFTATSTEREKIAASWAKLSGDEIRIIEEEAADAPVIGPLFVTSNAVVEKISQGPLVLPARDIMWIYGKQTKRKMYGVVTTSTSDSFIIVDRNAEKHEFERPYEASREPVEILYAALHPNFPGIRFGYDKEYEKLATSENISVLADFVDKENSKARV